MLSYVEKTNGYIRIEPGREHVVQRGQGEEVWIRLTKGGKEIPHKSWSSKYFWYHPQMRFETTSDYGTNTMPNDISRADTPGGESFYYTSQGVKEMMSKNASQAQNQGWKVGQFNQVPSGSRRINVQ